MECSIPSEIRLKFFWVAGLYFFSPLGHDLQYTIIVEKEAFESF